MTSEVRAPLSFSMRKVVHFLICVFVFTQPWDTIAWAGIGALSRVIGIVTLGAALFTLPIQGRFRVPNAIFWLAAAFVAEVGVSRFWTISPVPGAVLTWTYTQLLASVWLMQEFVRTRDEQQSLLVAFCLGAFVPVASTLNSYRLGVRILGTTAERYSSSGALYINADNAGLILVIGIPIAVYLMRHNVLIIRMMAYMYVVLGSVAILLTATRTAFLAGIVALSIAPLTQMGRLLRASFTVKMLLRATVLIMIVIAAAALVVPESVWARLSTIQSEIVEGGRMSGRSEIWRGGFQLFLERPLLGFGAGSFVRASGARGRAEAAHNLLIEILVEQGLVGLCIFLALLGACVVVVLRLPYAERKLWVAVMVAWLVGVMAINFGASKVTWLLFGLLAAQTAEASRRHVLPAEQKRGYGVRPPGFLPVHSPHVARTFRA